MSCASRWSRFAAYAWTRTRVISVSSVTWPSPFQNGENGFSILRWWRIDSITPSTQPPQNSWISRDSQPSVAPPSASPTAAPPRQAAARSVSSCPCTGARLAPDRVPAVGQRLDELIHADLVGEVLPERGRRDLGLPARVRVDRNPVALLQVRHGRDGVLPAAVVPRRADDDLRRRRRRRDQPVAGRQLGHVL